MPLGTDEIETQVIKALKDCPWNPPDPTADLLDRIRKVGLNFGYVVCPGAATSQDRQLEWLYDLVWQEKSGTRIVSVPLVLESEWSTRDSEIYYDFDKLLAANAPHKVMVFEKDSRREVEMMMERLRTRIQKFRANERGRFLLAGQVCRDEPHEFLIWLTIDGSEWSEKTEVTLAGNHLPQH